MLGKLEVDITNTDEILSEWKNSSLFGRADKPVSRFLLYGEEVSKGFLDRCIEMARRAYKAYEEGDVPSYDELDLPENLVKHFQEWWDKYWIRKPPQEKVASQFHRPIIALNIGLGEVQVKVPPQRVDRTEPKEASIEVLIEDSNVVSRNKLKVYKRNKLFETSEIQISLDKPAESYEIRLHWDKDIIKTWRFRGLNQEKPWLAFLSDSNKLIEDRTLSASQVWFVIPKDYSFEPYIPIIEECSQFYGNWKNYSCFLVDLSLTDDLCLTSRKHPERIPVPISTDKILEPKLVGGVKLNSIKSEDKLVYVGRPPNIQIPISDPLNPEVEVQRWRLSVVPQGQSSIGNKLKYTNLSSFIEVQKGQTSFQVSLSDERLLGEDPIGSFLIYLRGRLGKDRSFQFSLVPLLSIDFDKKIYLPDENGNISDAELTINTLSDAEIRVEKPSKIASNDLPGEFVITIPETETSLSCVWNYPLPSSEIVIPLTIRVPRLRWLLRGLAGQSSNEWLMTPKEIALSDWEDSNELELLVQAPQLDTHKVILGLKGSGKIETKHLREGDARLNLSSFSDELRNLQQPRSEFYLQIEGNDLKSIQTPILYIKAEWVVEELERIQEVENEQRIIYLKWKERGRLRNRAIRLWNLCQPWLEPIQQSIIHNTSELTIKCLLSELPPGNYRLEFFQGDQWVTQSTQNLFLPEAGAPSIFNIQIGSQDELSNRYSHLGSSFREQLEKLAILKLLKNDVKLLEQINQMKIENLSTENLRELAILLISWLPYEDKIRKLWNKLLAPKNIVLENQFENVLKHLGESVDEVNKRKVNHLAAVLNLTPPDSPYKKGEMVVHKVHGWIGCINGFSPTSKHKYGQWLLEIKYDKIVMTESMPLEKFDEIFIIANEKDLRGKRRKRNNLNE